MGDGYFAFVWFLLCVLPVMICLLFLFCITKTCLYNFDPHKPHFYIVKLGFTGVYIIFFYFNSKHRLWVLVEAVLTSTHNLCFNFVLAENFHFLAVKFSVYLNRRVFVMVIDRLCSVIVALSGHRLFYFYNHVLHSKLNTI